MKEALILIDVQNDYFQDGKCELYESENAVRVIKKLLDYFRRENLPIYFIQHIGGEGATFFIEQTKGVQIHKDIQPLPCEHIIEKHYPNSFYQTVLQEQLRQEIVTDLLVCGMMTHMCVDSTLRCAKELGYRNVVVADACATKTLTWNHQELPAELVQAVYMASFEHKFAEVIMSDAYLKKS